MALCKVIKLYPGWNVGDHIEAFDSRLTELVESGIVQVLIPDKIEEKRMFTKAVTKP